MIALPSQLSDQLFSRGSIFHSSDLFNDIGHGKFFVIIAVTPNAVIGYFFINTDINPCVFGKPKFLNLQYPLKQEFYPFLKYDSWLGCNNVLKVNKSALHDSLCTNNTTRKGDLTESDLSNILLMCRQSDVYSQYEKDTYFQ